MESHGNNGTSDADLDSLQAVYNMLKGEEQHLTRSKLRQLVSEIDGNDYEGRILT